VLYTELYWSTVGLFEEVISNYALQEHKAKLISFF
jgi:hypothetical protein